MLDLTRLLANQTDFMDTVAVLQEGQGPVLMEFGGPVLRLVSAAINTGGFPVI